MLSQTQGIVISQVAYGDTGAVVKIFTKQWGLLGFMVNGLKGGKGSIKPSHVLPLNLLEMVVYKKEGEGLQRIRELRCQPVLGSLHMHPLKSCIALFAAEVLQRSLHEHHPDEPLFVFLQDALLLLDKTGEAVANFPLWFLLQLSSRLGFKPKGTYTGSHTLFNLQEGLFVAIAQPEHLTAGSDAAEAIHRILQCGNEWWSADIAKQQRQLGLDALVTYLAIHLHFRHEIKSHKVLREVLG